MKKNTKSQKETLVALKEDHNNFTVVTYGRLKLIINNEFEGSDYVEKQSSSIQSKRNMVLFTNVNNESE